jgi:pimeloyl-ACP methyl ester carboxylesterase
MDGDDRPRIQGCRPVPRGSRTERQPCPRRLDDRGPRGGASLRPTGHRSTGSAPFIVRHFIEDLEALRVHWQHEFWIVGGHSWGGWLAVLYALAHPDQVPGLIGIGVPPPPASSTISTGARERGVFAKMNSRSSTRSVRDAGTARTFRRGTNADGFTSSGARSSQIQPRHLTSIANRSSSFQPVRKSIEASMRTWAASLQIATC